MDTTESQRLVADIEVEIDRLERCLRVTREAGCWRDLEAEILDRLDECVRVLLMGCCRTDGEQRTTYAKILRRIEKLAGRR